MIINEYDNVKDDDNDDDDDDDDDNNYNNSLHYITYISQYEYSAVYLRLNYYLPLSFNPPPQPPPLSFITLLSILSLSRSLVALHTSSTMRNILSIHSFIHPFIQACIRPNLHNFPPASTTI